MRMVKKREILRFWRSLKIPKRVINSHINALLEITEKSIDVMVQNIKRQLALKKQQGYPIEDEESIIRAGFNHILIYYIAYYVIKSNAIPNSDKPNIIAPLFNYSLRIYSLKEDYPYSFEFPSQTYVNDVVKLEIDENLFRMLLARDYFATKEIIFDNFQRVLNSSKLTDEQKSLYFILLIDYLAEFIKDQFVHRDATNIFLTSEINEKLKLAVVKELVAHPKLDFTALTISNNVVNQFQSLAKKLSSSKVLDKSQSQMLQQINEILITCDAYKKEIPTIYSVFSYVRGTFFKFYGVHDSFRYALYELIPWYIAQLPENERLSEIKNQVSTGVAQNYPPRVAAALIYVYRNIENLDRSEVEKLVADAQSLDDNMVTSAIEHIQEYYSSKR